MNGAALLIGNAAYDPLPGLQTPLSDVRQLADRMEAIGFATTVVENADHRRMNSSIAEFAQRVSHMEPGGSVLFYFAGHGAQVQGENYLMPVDAGTLNDEWRRGSVTLSSLLEDVCWRKDQQKLIVLDACRTNGLLSASRSGALGLSGVSTSSYQNVCETMILYAARPGQIALDGGAAGSSPLCRAMLDVLGGLERPLVNFVPKVAVKVEQYTGGQQDPWYTGNVKLMEEIPFWRRGDAPTVPNTPDVVLMPGGAIAQPHQFYNRQDEIVASKAHLVHKLKAKDVSGRWAYYFVLVEDENEQAFLHAIEGDGTVDLESYGSVVASCYGEMPTLEIKQYLRDRYGWEV